MAASAEGNESDPNLTPLLDVVLQLIMFFMITVNFVRVEPLSEQVRLPVAQSAVVLDDSGEDWVYLNVARPAPPPESAQELVDRLRARGWLDEAQLKQLLDHAGQLKQGAEGRIQARKLADDLRKQGLLFPLQIDQIFHDQGRLIVRDADGKEEYLDDGPKNKEPGTSLRSYLQRRKQELEGQARQRALQSGQTEDQIKEMIKNLITVIVSADGDVPAQRVSEVLDIANKAGLKSAKLRAFTRSLGS